MNKDGTLNVEGDLRETIKKLEQRIDDLEAKLVQRDVYEAEQRLPPEHAKEVAEMHALVERLVTLGNEMAATEAASGSVEAARKWRELVRGG